MNLERETKHEGESRLAAMVIRLVALWILAGAAFKLFLGTPGDLPTVVRELPLELGLTYKLAITAELSIAFFGLLKPRWTWPILALALLIFDLVVTTQIAAGDASCGCFGSSVQVSPWAMLAIDSALLAALLVVRPWRARQGSAGGPIALVVALAVGVTLPWVLDRQAIPSSAENEDGPLLRGWVELDLASWTGKEIGETPLAEHLDVYSLPLDGLWIFYRSTCDHCAEHLDELADTATGEELMALIRIREPNDTEANRVVHRMPAGIFVTHAELSDTLDYVITTPGELRLEGGSVVVGREAVTSETSLQSGG